MLGSGDVPLPGAAVTLIDNTGRQLGRTVSGPDGRYSLAAPDAGSFVLIGSAPGHQPQAATLLLSDAPVTCDVRLAGGGGPTGTVRTFGGEPLAGATAIAISPDGAVAATASADEKGDFALPELTPGSYTLTISAEGHRPHAAQLEITGTGQPPRIDAELRPAAKVRGTVRAQGGRPVEDARVALLDSAGDVVGQCVTGTDGAFHFEGDLIGVAVDRRVDAFAVGDRFDRVRLVDDAPRLGRAPDHVHAHCHRTLPKDEPPGIRVSPADLVFTDLPAHHPDLWGTA
ncbi:collagen binding domain-containing protein [Streptomyces sp. MCAF7]